MAAALAPLPDMPEEDLLSIAELPGVAPSRATAGSTYPRR